MTELRVTPSQTIGPFFAYGLTARQYGYNYTSLADGHLAGADLHRRQQIVLSGTVFDGNGAPVTDAMLELWQPDLEGHYNRVPIEYPADNKTFVGFGRQGTGTATDARFTFTTLKPVVTHPAGRQSAGQHDAPHINVLLFMRGSLRLLCTRLYFADETEANERDSLLSTVPENRRQTLLAQPVADGHYRFDIRMQGEGETVFFDL